ncbi:MAG: 16S rRNA (cytosine(1402)-N(4))-methyltransferase RsmH [Candidatus Woesebacteria bacterium]
MEYQHIPVLLQEAIDLLDVKQDHWYIDATFGRGGHTKEIIDRGGKVLALDQDKEAIAYGARYFIREIEDKNLILVRENFEHTDEVSHTHLPGVKLDGILADFGISSPQVDDPKRGFSFQSDAPLDMRMDDRMGVRAKDLVNGLGKKELYEILTHYAQEQHARIIVDAIIRARTRKQIETTQELANIIEKVVHRHGHLHPATKTFQALRIVINDELGSIERFLPRAFELLAVGGRLVTIAFHEGEDRLVKKFEQELEGQKKAEMLTKRPTEPSDQEMEKNPRSRSGKLRGIKRIL